MTTNNFTVMRCPRHPNAGMAVALRGLTLELNCMGCKPTENMAGYRFLLADPGKNTEFFEVDE